MAVRSVPLLLATALLIGSAAPSFASCEGGFCPTPPTPIPGLKSAAYLPANPSQQAAGLPTGSFKQSPAAFDPSQLLKRDPHPFVNAPLLPNPDSVAPATRLAFELADLQVQRLTSASESHIRRAEFHNAVDDQGNTFNASDRGVHFSVPLVLTSLFAILLASSLGLAFFTRVGAPAETSILADADQPLGPPEESFQTSLDPLPAIEWEQIALPPSDTWSSLLHACAGDVMVAAVAIKDQVSADPLLDPSSPEAFRRAIAALQLKSPPSS